jgi:hypothetical protein
MARRVAIMAVLAAAVVAGCAAGNVVRRSLGSAGPAPALGRHLAVAAPPARPAAPDRCAANPAGQLVLVSIAVQHVWMCAGPRAVYESDVTTGMNTAGTRTPTGHFTIQGRSTNTTLTLDTGAAYHVKYWIPFDAPWYGFHDSSWQRFAYGSAGYRTAGSHGCVHLPLAAMAFLYHWATVGAAVDIRA